MKENPSALLVDYYSLTMAAVYHAQQRNALATFELFVRSLPKERSFLVACGIDEAMRYLADWRFTAEDIRQLKPMGLPRDFLHFLKQLRFTGDVWAMKEGTVVFPEEPILRVTAPLVQAQLVEAFLLNAINLQTVIASKASRVVLAAQGAPVVDFSLRRTQGPDAAVLGARASYLAGCAGTSNVLAGTRFGIPVMGTMAHSFVMAFPDELTAFRAYARLFPESTILLLDTYNYEQGLRNAMIVAAELKRQGRRLQGVRLDSGDLAAVSWRVRQALNKQGFSGVRIVASGDLDEYKISRLKQQRAPIDSFGVGTHMGVSSDAPFCNVIYKLTEIEDPAGRFQPVMKLSEAKHTVPGRKQVFRRQDRTGQYQGDVISRADEKSVGIALLHPAVRNGTILGNAYSLRQTREYIREQVAALPSSVKKLRQAGVYSVVKSRRLQRLMQTVCRGMKIGRTRCV